MNVQLMMLLRILIAVATAVIQAILVFQLGYLLFLTLAALGARSGLPRPERERAGGEGGSLPRSRIAILVPAHNEERLLPELLASLHAQDYPPERFDILVVADNCSDGTARVAREGGAKVFERFNTHEVGKGYALNWLVQAAGLVSPRGHSASGSRPSTRGKRSSAQRKAESGPRSAMPYDAFLIFDADTVAEPDFLSVMDAHLQAGENAIQGYYAVRDPGQSWGVALRYAALAVLHYLRPLGRSRFGGSAGLKGNGMCFRASLYLNQPWSGSVTEDIEYHMNLVLAGERVAFAPDARLQAEMPGSLKSSSTQNVRWESGRLQAARVYVPRLLKAAFASMRSRPASERAGAEGEFPAAAATRKGAPDPKGIQKPAGPEGLSPLVLLDAVMEHLIPPTALIALVVALSLGLGALLGWLGAGWVGWWLAVALTLVLFAYVACGLALVGAPARVWLSFAYAPFYMLWKLVLLVQIVLGKRKQGWVRTQR